MRAVTDALDRAQDIAEPQLPPVPAHPGALGRVVDARVDDAGQPGELPFDQPEARGAGHAVENQAGLAAVRVERVRELPGDLRLVVGRGRAQRFGHGVARRRRQVGARAVVTRVAGGDDGLGDRRAAGAAHRPRRAVDDRREIGADGHRQTAMETGARRRRVGRRRLSGFELRSERRRHTIRPKNPVRIKTIGLWCRANVDRA